MLTGLTNIQLTVDETYTEQGATCEDNVDADKPATVGGDTVDTSTVGQYTVTYDCTDTSNNEATQVSRTVNVQTAVTPVTTLLADAFITTWRTDSANQTITIPVGGSTARYSIDWGDNSPAETDITGDSTHTYREADSYTVSISGGLERIYLNGQQPNAGRLASIEQWGDTRWTTMDAAFDGATNMVYRATDTPDLSGVTDMHRMFGDAYVFNGDLSSWDVSKVTDMSDMFIFAYDFNGDLSSWDVSSVTNMNEMFAVATSFNGDLSSWDVSKVTDMSDMFIFAYDFNGDLSSWDVSSVTDMNDMFYYATAFNQPLNAWDVSSVTDMFSMFFYTPSFTQNLGNWYVVANATSIARADVPGVVAEISAQNDHLNGHNPTYGISRDNDYAFFEIVNGNKINMTSVGTKSSYMVNVTASGSNVFESGNNWRLLVVSVSAALSDNADLGGLTISSGTLSPQFSSSDITYTASVDNSVTQVTVTPTASDSLATITVNGNTVTSGTGYILTGLTVDTTTVTVIVTAQDSTTKTYIITVTVRDVPITVSSAAYNPGNGQLTITFNQDIATVDYSGLHVRSSANPDTGGITLSSVTGADYSGRTITATLDSEQQDQYDALQSPHLVVEDGAVTDTDGDQTTDVPPQPIRDASQKGSSSSSKAPIVHINALAQSRLVDIPPHITEQVASHDASDPLEPITPDDTFDLPLVINGYGYLLDAYENTLIPQTVTAGDNPVHITFTVYTEKEFVHFILYLNLQGRNTNYADSDTYITYKDDGTTSITDPHGYIGSATVTVTQEDDSIPEKRTVRITIEFGEEPMGPTNMVAYMWNTDREALFVKIIDALEVVVASPESAMQAADPEPLEPDSVLPADPEPVTPDFAGDAADPEPVPYDILGPDDYDDTQILQIIRMWSGFESESITDEQLLELLGLDDHQGADIPDWMMTELGVLVAKGTVTVDEFMLALQYVLEHD